MRSVATRVVVVVLRRVLVTLLTLGDPAPLLARIRTRPVMVPLSPVLLVLLLALAGGALYLWLREHSPE